MANQRAVAVPAMLLIFLMGVSEPAAATKLEPEAARDFDRYVQITEQRMRAELQPGGTFLWVDSLPGGTRIEAHQRLKRGDVITERLATRDTLLPIRTPDAMIHHWVGTVFIPGASLQQVLTLLQDYDHHSSYYRPDVTKSKLLARANDDFKVSLRLTQKKIITVVLDTEYDVHYEARVDAAHAQSRSYSTRIVEIEHPGEPNERALPAGNDDGFLWRLYSYWRFSEADHGVYVQCEAISLTRDIPTGLHWLIGPFIESIPRESLEFTLGSTRTAALGESSHSSH